MQQIITTTKAPAPIGPYNQAILHKDTLYTSGQIAINPITSTLVLDSIADETRQVMQNIKAILEAANMSFKNVIKASIFLTDMNTFTAVNEVYGGYFNDNTAPARETIAVAALPKGVHVEISVIAVV